MLNGNSSTDSTLPKFGKITINIPIPDHRLSGSNNGVISSNTSDIQQQTHNYNLNSHRSTASNINPLEDISNNINTNSNHQNSSCFQVQFGSESSETH